MLREILDEIREYIQHAVTNHEPLAPPFQLRSLPIDPCADDFGERVNALDEDVIEALRQAVADGCKAGPVPENAARSQQELF